MHRQSRVILPLLLSALPLLAQGPPSDVPCSAAFNAPPPPCATEKPAATTVAVVDGTVITVSDLDEKLRAKVMSLGERVAEARKTARQVEVESKLFELEAARLHVAPRDLYFEQVIRKEAPVSEADVRAEYGSNSDLYGSRPLDAQRDWIEGNVAEKHEAARASAYAKELQKRFPLEEASVPADGAMAAAEYNTRMTLWRDERQAVEALIHGQLLKAEAARRKVTTEELTKAEVDARLKAPTDEELAVYYEKWKFFRRRWMWHR